MQLRAYGRRMPGQRYTQEPLKMDERPESLQVEEAIRMGKQWPRVVNFAQAPELAPVEPKEETEEVVSISILDKEELPKSVSEEA